MNNSDVSSLQNNTNNTNIITSKTKRLMFGS